LDTRDHGIESNESSLDRLVLSTLNERLDTILHTYAKGAVACRRIASVV
jgi:hypothetical protein